MSDCKAGKEKNASGRCVKKCTAKEVRNDEGKCVSRIQMLMENKIKAAAAVASAKKAAVPDTNACKAGKEKNASGRCVLKCTAKQMRNNDGKCVLKKKSPIKKTPIIIHEHELGPEQDVPIIVVPDKSASLPFSYHPNRINKTKKLMLARSPSMPFSSPYAAKKPIVIGSNEFRALLSAKRRDLKHRNYTAKHHTRTIDTAAGKRALEDIMWDWKESKRKTPTKYPTPMRLNPAEIKKLRGQLLARKVQYDKRHKATAEAMEKAYADSLERREAHIRDDYRGWW